jgi:hypothetical protein
MEKRIGVLNRGSCASGHQTIDNLLTKVVPLLNKTSNSQGHQYSKIDYTRSSQFAAPTASLIDGGSQKLNNEQPNI